MVSLRYPLAQLTYAVATIGPNDPCLPPMSALGLPLSLYGALPLFIPQLLVEIVMQQFAALLPTDPITGNT